MVISLPRAYDMEELIDSQPSRFPRGIRGKVPGCEWPELITASEVVQRGVHLCLTIEGVPSRDKMWTSVAIVTF